MINKYKVAKHFDWVIENGALSFSENADRITAEAALDGLYVIRTSVAEKKLTTAEAVLGYKQLSDVERAFRALKGVDLHVRPIRHRLERSAAALAKVLADGTPSLSFGRLLANMATIVRNTMRAGSAGGPTFALTTQPSPKQEEALALLAAWVSPASPPRRDASGRRGCAGPSRCWACRRRHCGG